MEKTIQRLKGCIFRIDYTIDYNEFHTEFISLLHRIRVPGFRVGHVPMVIINKMYGRDYLYTEVAKKIVGDDWNKTVVENNITPIKPGEYILDPVEKGEPVVIHYSFVTQPYFKLGEYKGLKVVAPKTEITEIDVNNAILNTIKKQISRTRVTDRPCNTGDLVEISLIGSVDGEPLDGGAAATRILRLGSHNFGDLETQVIGMQIDEERECTVHYPQDLSDAKLAGKTVVYQVTLKSITVENIPVLDDDFVQDISEFDTVEEYVADLRRQLEKKAASEDAESLTNILYFTALKNCEYDTPPEMLREQAQKEIDEEEKNFVSQGGNYDWYLSMNGLTKETLLKKLISQNGQQTEMYLFLQSVIEAEGMTVTDEDVDAYIEEQREQMGDRFEEYKASLTDKARDNLKNAVYTDKVFKLLKDNAEITYFAPEAPELVAQAQELNKYIFMYEEADNEAEKAEAEAEGEAAPAENTAEAEGEAAPAETRAETEGEAAPAETTAETEGEAASAETTAEAEGEAAPAETAAEAAEEEKE